MDLNKSFYPYQLSEDSLRFYFQSISDRKIIDKIVQYSPIPENETIYQLSFGDLQEDGKLDFLSVSDNNDTNMVLTTVIQTMFRFFELNPNKGVVLLGVTKLGLDFIELSLINCLTKWNFISTSLV